MAQKEYTLQELQQMGGQPADHEYSFEELQNMQQQFNQSHQPQPEKKFGAGLLGGRMMSGQEFTSQPYIKQVAQAFVQTAPKDILDFFKFIPQAASELAISAGSVPTDVMSILKGGQASTEPWNVPGIGKIQSLQGQAQESLNKPTDEPVSPWQNKILGPVGKEVINSNKPFGFHAFVAPILKLAMDGSITEGALKSAVKTAGKIFGDAPASSLLTGDFSKGTPGIVQKAPSAVKKGAMRIMEKSAQNEWARPAITAKASYSKARTIFDRAAADGNDLSKLAVDDGIRLSENVSGKSYDTIDTVANIRSDAGQAQRDFLRPALEAANKSVPYTPVEDIIQQAKDNIGNDKFILPEDKLKIISRIDNEVAPALTTKYPDGMSLTDRLDEKILRDANAGYKYTGSIADNLVAQQNKQLADVLRTDLKANVPSNIPFDEFQSELTKRYQLADYLESLHNKPIPKTALGKIANTTGKIAGVATAQHLGGGILMDVAGYHMGGMIENILADLPDQVRDSLLNNLSQSNPEAFSKLSDAISQMSIDRASQLALPPQRTIFANAPEYRGISPEQLKVEQQLNADRINQLSGDNTLKLERGSSIFGGSPEFQGTSPKDLEIQRANEAEILNTRMKDNTQLPPLSSIQEGSNKLYNKSRRLFGRGISQEQTIEQIIESKGGWQPGMRQKFDTALANADAKTVKELLPKVPKEYVQRFSSMINKILKKSIY